MTKQIIVCFSIVLAGMCFVDSVSAYSASEAMEALRKVHDNTIGEVQDTQPIRPAERPVNDYTYVEISHSQELIGLLVQCNDPAAIEGKTAGGKPIHVTAYTKESPYMSNSYNLSKLGDYLEQIYYRREYIDGMNRFPNEDKYLQRLIDEGLYIVDIEYGSYYEQEESEIVTFLTENESTNIVGILQTDWYLKGYYDNWDTALNIRAEDGKTINWDELNTPEYHHVRGGMIMDDGLTIDEIEELCEKLEARDDIAYAWVIGTYLGLPLANKGTGSHTVEVFDFGNLDSDGGITLKDAQRALRLSDNANLFDDTLETYDIRADIDGDGAVTLKDAQRILRYADELNLGYEPTWDEILG